MKGKKECRKNIVSYDGTEANYESQSSPKNNIQPEDGKRGDSDEQSHSK